MHRVCLLLVFITTVAAAVVSSNRKYNSRNKCTEILRDDINDTYHAFCGKNNYQHLEYLQPNTTRLSISKNDIPVLSGAPFRNLSMLTYLNLSGNKLKTIKSDAFEGLHRLQQLVLKDNMIKAIEEDLFKHCPRLQSIDFSSNFVLRLTTFAKAMAPLVQLNDINFSDNLILQEIGANDLRPLNATPITNLNLEQCQLQKIAPGALSHLRNLMNLQLSTNLLPIKELANALRNITPDLYSLNIHSMQLTDIPTAALQELSRTKIQVLNMKNNRFWQMNHGTFPKLPNLRILNLKQCDIQYFNGLVFANLTSLEDLDLSFNRLDAIPNTVFVLKNLKTLNMNNNQDHNKPNTEFYLGKKQFARMGNLETLYMERVKLGELTRFNLYGLTKLKHLYLSESLNEIEEYSFETLGSLEKLILSRCLVLHIPRNLFKGLTNLTNLDLKNTGVNINPKQLNFHDLPNLEILSLSFNKLTFLPQADIGILKKLQLLVLRNNAIIPWTEPMIYGKSSSLTSVDLKENNLDHVTPAMIDDFGVLTYVDVSKNPYNCSRCSMHEFAKWLNSTVNKTNDPIVNVNYIQCANPKTMRDMSVRFSPMYDYCIIDTLPQIIAITTSLSVITVLLLIGAIVGYRFRWYIRYYWFLTRSRVNKMKSESAADSFEYDAFISYNVADQDWLIKNLLPKLETEEPKFKVCLHERDFVIGKEIITNIVESINNSRFTVLLLSKNFLESQWCTWEMNMAQFMSVDDGRNALVLIMLEPIKKKDMSSTLKYLVKTRTYLEWTDNVQGQKLFWERLKFAIQRPVYSNKQPKLV